MGYFLPFSDEDLPVFMKESRMKKVEEVLQASILRAFHWQKMSGCITYSVGSS